jgi:hypothetical protein
VNIDDHRWSHNMYHYIAYHLGRAWREKDEGRDEKGGGRQEGRTREVV